MSHMGRTVSVHKAVAAATADVMNDPGCQADRWQCLGHQREGL